MRNSQRIKSRCGKVTRFDSATGNMSVSTPLGDFDLHMTSFHPGCPTRFPRVAETVYVVFADEAVLAVRAMGGS